MNIIKYIEKTNKEFEEASPEKKRVMIAKDVIKRIEWENLIATTGKVLGGSALNSIISSDSLKEVVNSTLKCECCAKGSVLCAYVGRVNQFTYGDIDEEDNIHSPKAAYHTKLAELFSLEQIDLIEIAFEGSTYIGVNQDKLQKERAANFI